MKAYKKKDPINELQKRVFKIKFIDNIEDAKKKELDFEKFKKLAKEVKKTFTNEDILRLRSHI